MIRQAALSLAEKGPQRTSFSEVLAAAGAPRGSLYHHFPGGKDELVLGALDAAGAWAEQGLEPLAGRPAPDIARGFIDLWRSILERSHFAAGCAVAAVTVASEEPELQARSAQVFRQWRARLAALLAEGGVARNRAEAIAASLIAGCEGAVILSRAERSIAPFNLVAAELIAAVTRACEAPPEGR
jgi:AcrR family transcriptional regulator